MHIAFMLSIAIISANADNLIPEHGKYSESYCSDWSELPTGKELAGHDLAGYDFREVKGEDVRKVFRDQPEVRLSGERLKVSWGKPECDKYRHTLYMFVNCEKIIIEDMAIINADPDFRASSTFFFEGCGRVEIRDSYIAGACGRSMIRLEGCEEYFIDRLELAGHEYPEAGVKAGPGIFINNGAGWDEDRQRPGQVYAQSFRELKWGVIQNSYIHGHPNLEPDTNHDGILFHAPADGIVFNCVFEDYEGDSCLDISHRRSDAGYRNHHYRIERCIFEKCHRVKTNGAVGSSDCSITWCNNLYINSMLTDYHVGWPNWHIYETFIRDDSGGYFLTMNCRGGATLFRNCLLYSPAGRGAMYEPWGYEDEDDTWIRPDHFMYAMPPPRTWVKPRRERGRTIDSWEDWQAAGFDANSVLTQADPLFADPDALDFRLTPTSPAAGAGTAEIQGAEPMPLPINTDFHGRPRPTPPSCGAFEVSGDVVTGD